MDWTAGDLAACYGGDVVSRVIGWGTASVLAPRGLRVGPSHVAMICEHAGRPVWVESTMLCLRRCVVTGRQRRGVQAHEPASRVADYAAAGGRVERYRLTDINSLSREERGLLSRILIRRFVRGERRYDLRGALRSGGRLLPFTRLFPSADLERLFCSELAAAVLMRLNRMNHSNPARYNPARLLRELVRTGKYERALEPGSLAGEATVAELREAAA
ncbi:MAG: hypothetical protein KF774_08240 [Planctomyces sp.]|nr:hypothetical protein [Planctomyces sp.]